METDYEGLRDMLLNPRHTDLTITCEDGACFQVHRIVISLHSSVLTDMITEEKDESGQIVSRIQLNDIDSDIVYMVLQFLYGGNYLDYETFGSYHTPSYVIFMTPTEIKASLKTLPCLHGESAIGISSDDDEDYEDDGEQDTNMDDEEEEDDENTPSSESVPSYKLDLEAGRDRDDRRIRNFQGHNLFDSLAVYRVASYLNITTLQLVARDRFYRTAEKALMFSPGANNEEETRWLAHDHQRSYRSLLAEAVFYDFPDAMDELYESIPHTDTMMRSIPPILIAAGYNDNGFRDHVNPLLVKYPDLALEVMECLRMPFEGT